MSNFKKNTTGGDKIILIFKIVSHGGNVFGVMIPMVSNI